MKYVKQVKAKLYFERGIPTRLRSVAGKANFSRPLRLDAATATEQQVLEARIEAQRMYDLYLKTLENTSADAYADNEIEALAADVLRRNKATAGQYAPHMLGPKLQENDPDLTEFPQVLTGQDHATLAVPEYLNQYLRWHQDGDLDQEGKLTRSLTAQEEAVIRAWEAVQKVNNQAPRTITSLWQAYLTQNRRFDLDNPLNREQKRIIRRFEKFMKFCPDVVINDTIPELIQQGLDDIVAAEEQRQMAPESIRRNLTEVVSAFNWAIKKYRLKWQKIEMPTIEDRPDYIPKAKDVLLTPEQVQFYNAAVDANTPLAAALLLMLHCGAMATEVARLRIDEDLHLDHQLYPYVAMLGGRRRQTKTPTRPRFVPIVFGLDLIRRRLPEAIETLGKLKDPSAKLNAELRKLTNNKKLTGHCLRHTFKMQTDNKLMSPEITYAIAGWAGGWINKVANKYGSAGFGENEQLQTLNKELARVFEAIVEEDKQRLAHGSSNVLPFSGDKNK